jgi:dihydropteroate synthase
MSDDKKVVGYIRVGKEEQRSGSLADALPKEIERVQELIKEYESVPMGHIAASLMKEDIKKAHAAMMSGDLVATIAVYEELKGYE